MLVRTDIPNLLLAGMKKEFMKQFKMHVPEWERVASKIISNKATETYPWLGGVADLHEWTDERIPEGLLEHDFAIINYDWESSIAVDRNALDDEQYGQIGIRVRDLADKAKRFWGRMVYSLLNIGDLTVGTGLFAGKAITCYDGQAFFSAAHQSGTSGIQSNIGTVAFSLGALRTALIAMQQFVDDKGNIMDIRPDLLVVHPNNQFLAREILNSQYYPVEGTTTANLANNVMKGALELYVTPHVDEDFWCVLDTTGVMKPLILQLRKDVTFSTYIDTKKQGTWEGFMRKKIYFGVDWRGNAGFGLWQYAYAANPDWA